ncbi:MAG TPA: hypothetical protein VGK88_12770 [bacterium]
MRLNRAEVAAGHPVTDPVHSAQDLAVIRLMAAALRHALENLLPGERPVTLRLPDVEAQPHHVVVTDDQVLRQRRDLAFVGFFAHRRVGLDFGPLEAVDDELILEFPRHPGIISYGSLRLVEGNWANLIMLDPPAARDHWRTSAKHAYAARELAPHYYAVVRLHNGYFPGGLISADAPVIARTAYYDYQGPAPWRAERWLG